MRYLDPKNDLTFKKIFGQHKKLCISLLNSLLPLEKGGEIETIEYLSTELLPEISVLKNSIVDVQCTDKQGRIFIVEMQMYWSESFKQRVLFNASKAYVRQLDSGKDYKLLNPVYVLSFINDIFEKDIDSYYHHYKIVNIEHTDKTIEGLQFIFVELPKFKAKNFLEKKMQVLWLDFLSTSEQFRQDIPEELLENDLIREAFGYLEESSYSKEELSQYDKYLDSIRTEMTIVSDALAEGMEKGKLEERMNIARQLKAKNISIEIISLSTGLTEVEIENL